jgi:hypothetical protein
VGDTSNSIFADKTLNLKADGRAKPQARSQQPAASHKQQAAQTANAI